MGLNCIPFITPIIEFFVAIILMPTHNQDILLLLYFSKLPSPITIKDNTEVVGKAPLPAILTCKDIPCNADLKIGVEWCTFYNFVVAIVQPKKIGVA